MVVFITSRPVVTFQLLSNLCSVLLYGPENKWRLKKFQHLNLFYCKSFIAHFPYNVSTLSKCKCKLPFFWCKFTLTLLQRQLDAKMSSMLNVQPFNMQLL